MLGRREAALQSAQVSERGGGIENFLPRPCLGLDSSHPQGLVMGGETHHGRGLGGHFQLTPLYDIWADWSAASFPSSVIYWVSIGSVDADTRSTGHHRSFASSALSYFLDAPKTIHCVHLNAAWFFSACVNEPLRGLLYQSI